MANGVLTVSDIMTRVRRTFGDEAAVQVEDGDIFRWINDACKEIVMQHENLLQASSNIDSVVGQSLYTPPADCFSVNTVLYRSDPNPLASYYTLRYMSMAQMDKYVDGWRGNDAGNGTPQLFTRADAGQFALWPAPDTAYTGGIKVVYARYAAEVTLVTDPIDLPPYYHPTVEHFCMMKAYELDEDWESADKRANIMQSTISFNNGREAWYGRETYPVITTGVDDL